MSDPRRFLKCGTLVVLLVGPVALADPPLQRLSAPIPATQLTLETTPDGQRPAIAEFGTLQKPGVPRLPVRIFPIAIPPGAEVVRVTHTAADPVRIPLEAPVPLAKIWEPIGHVDEKARVAEQERFDAHYTAVYGSDEPYPASPVEFLRTAGFRDHNLVDVRVTPVIYRPLSGQLLHYTDITIHVDYRLPERRAIPACESSAAIEASARELILNHDQASAWCSDRESRNPERYEFVLITLDELVDDVSRLISWEQHKGRNVQVVTTQWIAANYSGVDLAQQIRNFLRDKYSADDWGIEYVLLVGHYDDLPMRVVWQDLGYGRPKTDTYYAELSLPDSDSWDSDGDGLYAEGLDDVDYYTEVSVGRIPFSDPAVVRSASLAAVDFEQDQDPSYKRNILLAGSFFWPDTDTAVLMEAIAAAPHMSGWTQTRAYESGYSIYPMDYDISHANLVSDWSSSRYAVVSWAGHGTPTEAYRYYYGSEAFIESEDCAVLDADYPSIVFADSCSTSTPPSNLGREMLRQGAVGYVGATQVAGGRAAWQTPADGSSQTLSYLFTTYVSSGLYTQGEALQLALRQTYLQGAWAWPRYEMLEWGALYGNPDLGVGALPALRIHFPEGLPESVAPDTDTPITVRIDPVLDTLVADSATLHYRTNGGSFQSVPMSQLGDKLHQAVLPATGCDGAPEFYFSASGAASGAVTEPADAPAGFYSAVVGDFTSIYYDDLEQDRGWIEENLGAHAGLWERGVPIDDPGWPYDPHSDADGSGQCYLTANQAGNSGVKSGSVRLTSPVIDMTAAGASLRYAFFLYTEDTSGDDYLRVELSDNDLAGPWYEVARYSFNDGLRWRSDSITASQMQALGIGATDQMRVRYTAHEDASGNRVEAGVDAIEVLGFDCSPGVAAPAGRVPGDAFTPGTPLTVDKTPGGELELAWGASCLTTDGDYAVYEGAIGDFESHQPVLCSTGGATTATIAPGIAGRYYLIVPQGTSREGSYGMDSGANERPPGSGACLSQEIGACP